MKKPQTQRAQNRRAVSDARRTLAACPQHGAGRSREGRWRCGCSISTAAHRSVLEAAMAAYRRGPDPDGEYRQEKR